MCIYKVSSVESGMLETGECINSGMEYWTGGMEFFKVQYQLLHPNKYNSK